MSLRLRIVLLVLLATLTPAVVLGLYLVQMRAIDTAKAEKSLNALAAYAAVALEGRVSATVQLLHGLSRAPALGGDDKAACSAFLADVLRRYPQYTGLLTIRPDGQLHCDSLATGRTLDLNDRAYFKRARASAEPAFEAVFGRLTGIAVLQVAFPAYDERGNLNYVLLASLNLAQFSARFSTASPHAGMEMLIWDSKGTLMTRHPDGAPQKLAGSSLTQSGLYRFAQSAVDGDTVELPGPDGAMKIWAHSALPGEAGGGMRITLGVPREVLLADANEGLRRVLTILAGTTLLAFLSALISADVSVGRPVARITKAAARQGAGDAGARIGGPYPRGELGGLMATLDSTAASVQAQQAEISRTSEEQRASNRRLRVLSAINSTIVRVHDRDELLAAACRIAASEGDFPIVWAGLVDRETRRVNPIAWQGVADDYMQEIRVAETHEGAPVASVIRDKLALIVPDISAEARLVSRDTATALGSRSLVILPLIVAGEVAGVFVLHARKTGFFDAQEMKLLSELAGDIGFALEFIETSERLKYLAFHDPLTGLANRALLTERLGQTLSMPGTQKLAVLVVDIERFRTINVTLGRDAGDELLKQFAERTKLYMRDARWLARIGADQFATIIPDVANAGAIQIIEQRLVEVLGSPFSLGGTDVRIAVRIGIALFPDDGADADTLLRNAEAALKKAKATGERQMFYNREMTARLAQDLALENQLRQALERNEFRLFYQPKFTLATGRIAGVEALLRWQSPDHGLVMPATFLPLLEQTGLAVSLGAWTLNQVARDQGEWRAAGIDPPRVAVNISSRQFRQRDFAGLLERAIRGSGVRAAIDLEISESLAMEDIEDTLLKFRKVRALGAAIAIDDFGTGASSLASLSKLPVQSLKIDRSFIGAMLDDPQAMTLVSTIITLAHALNLTVVAKGVELDEQAKLLRLLRCEEVQGNMFGLPLSQEALQQLLLQEAGSLV